jgi:hypothetical protein
MNIFRTYKTSKWVNRLLDQWTDSLAVLVSGPVLKTMVVPTNLNNIWREKKKTIYKKTQI